MVFGTGEEFIPNRVSLIPKSAKRCRCFSREILVNLEFQALCSSGRSIVPSRANSAAYASDASRSAC